MLDLADRTVGALLAETDLPALEARALLALHLGVTRERLIAQPQQRVSAADIRGFARLVERRQRGEPLAYLLGEKEFYGRMFFVSPAVLIPRPETELLVDTALRMHSSDAAHVLDLGTGSGCIAITLALERTEWQITATDLSNDALQVARANADRLQAKNVTFRAGSWFSAEKSARFDLIVSDPPYVAGGDPHLNELRHEPLLALTAEDNGLACLRTIIDGAPSHLCPGGALLLEHGHDQASAVREWLTARGWRDVRTVIDLAGIERVTCARSGVV